MALEMALLPPLKLATLEALKLVTLLATPTALKVVTLCLGRGTNRMHVVLMCNLRWLEHRVYLHHIWCSQRMPMSHTCQVHSIA